VAQLWLLSLSKPWWFRVALRGLIHVVEFSSRIEQDIDIFPMSGSNSAEASTHGCAQLDPKPGALHYWVARSMKSRRGMNHAREGERTRDVSGGVELSVAVHVCRFFCPAGSERCDDDLILIRPDKRRATRAREIE
jgi:hypothetical protein